MPARRADLRAAAAALLPGAAFGALLALAALLLALTLGAHERPALWALVEPRIALVVMLWFLASLAAGAALQLAWRRWGAVPGRLAEQLQVLAASGDDHALALDAPGSSADARALVAAANALVRERQALRSEIAARVAEASRAVEQERSRLAALMAELNESVVVCNLDGRILLFNARARLQLRTLADAAGGARIGGVEPVALGRSIYALLERRLVAHALEAVRQRLARGAAHPTAQFVTGTAGGQLLRVQLAPVRAIGASASGAADATSASSASSASSAACASSASSASSTSSTSSTSSASAEGERAQGSAPAPTSAAAAAAALPDAPLNGFVLLLDNITREIA
ncbi:MAG TPA: hypothetical protein PLT38_09270, partial [Rubrivivax sp.]|nr:hypothetical protein [Rubrivivax sp.]